jgi:hypothetical protein
MMWLDAERLHKNGGTRELFEEIYWELDGQYGGMTVFSTRHDQPLRCGFLSKYKTILP